MGATYAVLLVYSTGQALRIEKLLTRGGVPCRLVPLPAHLTSDTGVCIRVNALDREMAIQILKANGASVDAIHMLEPAN